MSQPFDVQSSLRRLARTSLSTRFPFSLRCRATLGSMRARGPHLVALALLAGCGTADGPEMSVGAQWQPKAPPERSAGRYPSERRPTVSGGQESGDTVLGGDGPDLRPFPPFRLAFVGETADRILRRLGELANIQYVAPGGILENALVTVDVDVSTYGDLYGLVEWIGRAIGSNVRWRDNVAYFSEGEGVTSPSDGYLIRSSPIPDALAQIAADRFAVDCTNEGRLSVCVGGVLDIEDARRFFAALDGAFGAVSWRIVEASAPVSAIVASLGLTDRVVATEVRPGRWLIAASDARLLDLVLSAVGASDGEDCELRSFQPVYVDPEPLGTLLGSGIVELCGEPVLSDRAIFFSARGSDLARATGVLTEADAPVQLARLLVVVAQETEARRLGLLSDVSFSVPDFGVGEGLQLTASLADAVGWRTLELTTDGEGAASITATDRVQGDVIVTDGGTQIVGREERTVGLSVDVDGAVTPEGFRGRLQLTDSVLDGEIERGSNCAGFLTVSFARMARVCAYRTASRSSGIATDGLNRADLSEDFVVIAALLEHETAALDTLRIVLDEVSVTGPELAR